ncbi:uncharacterized protein LOC120848823 [Ixodes scapularis]|uniref:uncharacterized protein LOC120848823 n=1 Tax=Ixodes scapularis TaxID=6945 RepID=UPI001C3909A7|nr:uncharacterized protein LOC120848823 [Ixodes scapularis]
MEVLKGTLTGKDTFTSAEPGYQERKFLVFESCLEQLFSVCKTCYSPCDVSMKGVGTLLVVRTSCPAGHTNRWDSQPYINGKGAGNLLLTSLVLFTGASPTRTLRLFQLMNIQVFSKKTYFNYQRAILVPAVEEVWRDEQEKLMEELRDQPLDLAGDGRCDSPGFSAKYLTYSLHVPSVNKILHFEQIQVGEKLKNYLRHFTETLQCEAVRCSGHMEKEGLVRSLAFTRDNQLTVQSLATDRHRSIGKHMREKEPAILHYFDVWHVSKSLLYEQIVFRIGRQEEPQCCRQEKDCRSIADSAQPAVNHLYWCAAASQGNAELLVDAWCSMTRHVVNIHTDHPGIYTTCFHNPIEEGEWLVPDTPAHARFVDVVTSKSLLKDLRQLSPHTQTYALESFHSVLNGFAPKTRIAALHYNENGNRE